MAWAHFDYTSGANPFIAMREDVRDEVIARWRKRGVRVEEVRKATGSELQMFLVHDKEGACDGNPCNIG